MKVQENRWRGNGGCRWRGDIRQASSCEIFCIGKQAAKWNRAGKTDDIRTHWHAKGDGYLGRAEDDRRKGSNCMRTLEYVEGEGVDPVSKARVDSSRPTGRR